MILIFCDFAKDGTGTYICNDEDSLSDCGYGHQITLGVKTDENYRKRGFGIKAVSETIKECFKKGHKTINRFCVDLNQDFMNIAEKLGFAHNNDYLFFAPNISEKELADWAEYLEAYAKQEPNLVVECLYSYMKTNNVARTIEAIKILPQIGHTADINEYAGAVLYFQGK